MSANVFCRHCRFCVFAFLAFFLCGDSAGWASGESSSEEKEKGNTAKQVDPVAQLKSLVRVDDLPVAWRGPVWFKGTRDCVIRLEDISYDVRKTDSLVSPYQGEIRVSVLLADREPDEFGNHRRGYMRKYVYQDGDWVPLKTPYFIDGRDDSIKEIKDRDMSLECKEFLDRVLAR